jgi:TolA-binding protein
MKKMLCVLAVLVSGLCLYAEDPFASGLSAYTRSDWSSAMLSFRKAASQSGGAEPWYWLIMSELSAEDYASALKDIDRFAASFPEEPRLADTIYQKGRIQHLLGQYDASINTLYTFIVGYPEHAMVASAYYWIGESLYSVGRFEEARAMFDIVLDKYPQAVKREAAVYRMALIDQGSKQDELLKLLKISHEESLRIIEDYQRREKTYEQAIAAYQKRIAEMLTDTRIGDLEKQLAEEKNRNAALEARFRGLDSKGDIVSAAQPTATGTDDSTDASKKKAIEELKEKAQVLQNTYDTAGGK